MNRATRRAQRKPHKPARHSQFVHLPSLLLAYGQPDFTPAEATAQALPKRLAFERICHGVAAEPAPGQRGQSDSHEMAELSNMLVMLSEHVTTPQAREHVEGAGKAAQDAVLHAQAQQHQGRVFAFDPAGTEAIAHALDVYEELLPLIKPAHLAQALATMLKRQAQGQVFTVQHSKIDSKK